MANGESETKNEVGGKMAPEGAGGPAKGRLTSKVGETREAAARAAGSAKESLEGLGVQMKDCITSNPRKAVAIAAVAGMAIGALAVAALSSRRGRDRPRSE